MRALSRDNKRTEIRSPRTGYPELDQAISETIPASADRFESALFAFARRIKAHPILGGVAVSDLRFAVNHWHRAVGIGTSDEAWETFQEMLPAAQVAHGEQIMQRAIEHADRSPLPECPTHYTQRQTRLTAVCESLQRIVGSRDFFLSGGVAAQLLGVTERHARRMLKVLRNDGIIRLTERGRPGRSNRYRYHGWKGEL